MMPRHLAPELMDAPDVDEREHRRALAGLRRINALSGVDRGIVSAIVRFARDAKRSQLSLLDIASGGGDVPLAVARRLRSRGIDVDLTLFDRSMVGLEGAVRRATALGFPVRAIQGNAIEPWPQQPYDVITCSLFLHHLSGEDVVRVLANAGGAARRSRGLLVVNDLRRSRAGLLAATMGSHLLSRSPLVHHDGPASVRAAWTRGELHDFAIRAGLDDVRVVHTRPWRLLLTWRG